MRDQFNESAASAEGQAPQLKAYEKPTVEILSVLDTHGKTTATPETVNVISGS